MHATFTSFGWAVIAVSLFGALAVPAGADEGSIPTDPAQLMAALVEAGQPGEEHARLDPLVGTWRFASKFWLDPNQAPMEALGTIERRWMLGGRFLEERIEATSPDGKPVFEGFGLIGFDKGKRKFTSNWASSMCTSTCTGLGTVDSSGTVFSFTTEAFCPLRKEVVKGREELRFESHDKTVVESYQVQDGKEIKMMEIVATRQN
jgi:hypothetical protein